MNTLLNTARAGLLLAAILVMPAMAAQTPSFSATASGGASSLTVVANISVADADLNQPGSIYMAANTGNAWYFHNGAAWLPWTSGAFPRYFTGTLTSRSFDVIRNTDASFLGGTQVYVGYGRSESDMLSNNKVGMVYTLPSALTSSEVSKINTALGNGMNAIAAAYATTGFSQGFAAAYTFPLNGQVACPVSGRITFTGNVVVTTSETNATIQGQIAYKVSDPTNNLNDCNVGDGLILTGTLTFTIAGSATAGVGFSLSGYLNVNRRGPTGGLVPAGGGWVFLNLPRGGTRVTGSIFGTPI